MTERAVIYDTRRDYRISKVIIRDIKKNTQREIVTHRFGRDDPEVTVERLGGGPNGELLRISYRRYNELVGEEIVPAGNTVIQTEF